MDVPEAIAKGAEIGGACTAVTCAGLNWLAKNHDAVTSMCGFGGLCVAVFGLIASIYFQQKRDKREERALLHAQLQDALNAEKSSSKSD